MVYFNQLLFIKNMLIFLLPLKNRGGPTSSASMDQPPLLCMLLFCLFFLAAPACSAYRDICFSH